MLYLLLVEVSIITIDAKGCQTAIAEKIVSKEAEYLLAVKGNQDHLLDDIKDTFTQTPQLTVDIYMETAHGEIEKRACKVITAMDWKSKAGNKKKLQSLNSIETKRTDK